MEFKLIKQECGYILRKQGFFYASTDHQAIEQLNIEEGPIRHKLSIKNCQEIEHGYDLEELADKETERYATLTPKSFKRGFLYGFQKALSILGDKKFSEEHLIDAVMLGCAFENPGIEGIDTYNELKDLTIERSTQTEWYCTFNPDEKDSEGCLILKCI